MSLIDFLFSDNITEAKRIISERIEEIVSAKLEEKKKQLSVSERRELRANYRNLHDETEGNENVKFIFNIF